MLLVDKFCRLISLLLDKFAWLMSVSLLVGEFVGSLVCLLIGLSFDQFGS
jgi:hypothetical protein